METKTKLVPDKLPTGATEEEQIAILKSQSVVAQWQLRNPTFKNTKQNAEKIGQWLIDNRECEFNADTLDAAFEALKSQLDLQPVQKQAVKKEVKQFPWSDDNSITLTKQQISKADSKTFLSWRNHPAFAEQCRAIGVQPW